MFSIIWIIIGWSITSILVNGTILDSVRNYLIVKAPSFSKLLTCIQCSGFWVGALLGTGSFLRLTPDLLPFLTHEVGFLMIPMKIIFYGFLNSGVSVILDSFVVFLIKEKNNF